MVRARLRRVRMLLAGVVPLATCTTGPRPTVTEHPMSSASPAPAPAALRYVALGDSYTIGTGVNLEDRWPDQLVAQLNDRGLAVDLVANLGVNGYTSGDVIADELPELDDLRPDLVSILVGVNDVVQRVPAGTYRANVQQILGALLARLPRERIVVVSTPDYTRTPRGADFGPPESQRAGIAEFNSIMREESAQRGIAFVDIGPVADGVGGSRDLVAADLLHPSGMQYGLWVDLIERVVVELLAQPAG